MQGATDIFNVFWQYNGKTWLFLLFLAAVVLLSLKMDRNRRRFIVIAVLAAILLVFNEAVFDLVSRINGSETYYRFLWMIPVVPVLAYAAVRLIILPGKWTGRLLALLLACLLVAGAGDCYITAQSFRAPSQVTYYNPQVVHLCNLISADKETDYPLVACDFSLALSIRLQDPTIRSAIKRGTYSRGDEMPRKTTGQKRQYKLWKLVNGRLPARKAGTTLAKAGVDYVILAKEVEQEAALAQAGCSVVGETQDYTLYRTA